MPRMTSISQYPESWKHKLEERLRLRTCAPGHLNPKQSIPSQPPIDQGLTTGLQPTPRRITDEEGAHVKSCDMQVAAVYAPDPEYQSA